MSTDPRPLERFVALDALRGVAAFVVLFYHLGPLDIAEQPHALTLFPSGYLAVDLFFVLSGFVISHAYGKRLKHQLTFRKFIVGRFIRLQPAIAIGTLAGFGLALTQRATESEGAPGFFAIATSLPVNLLMLPNILLPSSMFLFNPPAWSLFYELLANIAYGLVMRFKSGKFNQKYRWFSQYRHVTIIILIIGLGCTIASALTAGDLNHGVSLQDWPVALSRITLSFSLGILLYRNRKYWLMYTPKVTILSLVGVCMALFAVAPETEWRPIYDIAFVTLASPLLVILGSKIEPIPAMLPAAQWFGLISYPLYAIHAPTKHIIENIYPTHSILLFTITAMTVVFIALLTSKIDPIIRLYINNVIIQYRHFGIDLSLKFYRKRGA